MNFAVLGEQDTGKSSYLVTLYGALENGVIDDVQVLEVFGDVGFLNRGLESLARDTRVKRTDVDAESSLGLRLRGPSGEFTVNASDRSGELLKNMINGRMWDRELLDSVEDLDGAILFLHVLRFDPGLSADELNELLGEQPTGPEPSGSEADPTPWTPALMPGDVRAIDLLQSILDARSRPLPLAVVISAWDRAQASYAGPGDWMVERAPMFAQFLSAQGERLPHALFGVSAQGYDFIVPTDDAETIRERDPWDRARTVDAAGDLVSLIDPLLWLVKQTPASSDA